MQAVLACKGVCMPSILCASPHRDPCTLSAPAKPSRNTFGDKGQLGGKALHMIRLLLQEGVGDELREVGVAVPCVLEQLVQPLLQVLPDGEPACLSTASERAEAALVL